MHEIFFIEITLHDSYNKCNPGMHANSDHAFITLHYIIGISNATYT